MRKVATLILLATFVLCLILVFKYSKEERKKWHNGMPGQTGENIQRRQQRQDDQQPKPMAAVNMIKEKVKEPEFVNKEYTKVEKDEREMVERKRKEELAGKEKEEDDREGGMTYKKEPRKYPAFEKGQDQLNRVRKYGVAQNLASANLDAMSLGNLLLTVHSYLDNTDVICARKLRMGKVGDGGWEICDDPDVRPRAPCIIYSFGIKWDFSFDDDAARLYKCHVYSFDPSMDLKTSNRSNLVHFYKLGIYRSNTVIKAGKVSSLKEIRAMLGHQNTPIDVLKMDVEASEWSAIPNMIDTKQLKDVKQFLVEFHVSNSGKWTLQQRLKAIQALEKEGFKRFYVHKNPSCKIGPGSFPVGRTKCYEIHYIRR